MSADPFPEGGAHPKKATVVLLGKLGHGKTRLLNAVCGTSFQSCMTARSCTTTIQHGKSTRHGIQMIDTPGFFSSSDTAGHTQCQKNALECCALSGVYLVVKSGRVDAMVGTLSTMMDFIGDDDVRIIITFVDAEWTSKEENPMSDLTRLLDVKPENMLAVGLQTKPWQIEQFIEITLHSPRYFRTDDDHEALVKTLHVGSRKLFSTVDSIAKAQPMLQKEDEEHLWAMGSKLVGDTKGLSPENNLELVCKIEDSLNNHAALDAGSSAFDVLTSVLRAVKYPAQGTKRKATSRYVFVQREEFIRMSTREKDHNAISSSSFTKRVAIDAGEPREDAGPLELVKRKTSSSLFDQLGDGDCSISSTSVVDDWTDVELGESFQGLRVSEKRHEPNQSLMGRIVCFWCWSDKRAKKKQRVRRTEEVCC